VSHVRTILECPKCHALVAFDHAASNLKLCTCGSVVHRINTSTGSIQELIIADTLQPVTVTGYYIKPGTTGEWNGKPFRVSGKMGAWFEESFYSYWFIVFTSGETGFLAEGYGMFAVLLPEKSGIITDVDLSRNKVGQVSTLTNYQLQKKNSCYFWEVEGELHLPDFSPNFDLYEYASTGGKRITAFRWGNYHIDAYESFPTYFDALNLKNIQEKDPYGKEITCPNCSKRIKIATFPLAQSCACDGCNSFYAIENHQPVQKGNSGRNWTTPFLAPGAKGVINGIAYEVMGYTQKQEQNSYGSIWREYTLFNPKYGFGFISEYDGHFIFLKETNACPVITNDNNKEFVFRKKTFNLFNTYTYKVIEAKGEFPCNIFDNKNTQTKEYISPPEIWIREKDNHEGITWFYGQHISSGELTNAFPVHGMVPPASGVGAVEPSSFMGLQKMIITVLIAIGALLLIHLLFIMNRQDRIIIDKTYSIADSVNKTTIITEKFDLPKWRSNLTFEISAPVNNSWFELSATLVNTENGEEYSIQQGVEYYYGYTGGENWSEGGSAETAYMTNIPAGNYFLKIEGTRESSGFNKTPDFAVKVIYDRSDFRNLWFALLLMIIWPVLNYIVNSQTEKDRWTNSPYSNYLSD